MWVNNLFFNCTFCLETKSTKKFKKIYIEPCLPPGRLRTRHSLTPCFGKLSTPHIFLPPHFVSAKQFGFFRDRLAGIWRAGNSWRAGRRWRESENIWKSAKAPPQAGFPDQLCCVRTTLHRFSMFSESGLKHSPGGPFLPAEVFVTQAGLLTFLPAPPKAWGQAKK